MDQPNPYQSPASPAAAPPSGLAGSTRFLLVGLVIVQAGVTLLSLPDALQQVRYGMVSPLAFLGALLATVVVVLGGALLLARRLPSSIFLVAAALGALTAMQWRPPFVLTGIAIGTLAAVIVLTFGSRRR